MKNKRETIEIDNLKKEIKLWKDNQHKTISRWILYLLWYDVMKMTSMEEVERMFDYFCIVDENITNKKVKYN